MGSKIQEESQNCLAKERKQYLVILLLLLVIKILGEDWGKIIERLGYSNPVQSFIFSNNNLLLFFK